MPESGVRRKAGGRLILTCALAPPKSSFAPLEATLCSCRPKMLVALFFNHRLASRLWDAGENPMTEGLARVRMRGCREEKRRKALASERGEGARRAKKERKDCKERKRRARGRGEEKRSGRTKEGQPWGGGSVVVAVHWPPAGQRTRAPLVRGIYGVGWNREKERKEEEKEKRRAAPSKEGHMRRIGSARVGLGRACACEQSSTRLVCYTPPSIQDGASVWLPLAVALVALDCFGPRSRAPLYSTYTRS